MTHFRRRAITPLGNITSAIIMSKLSYENVNNKYLDHDTVNSTQQSRPRSGSILIELRRRLKQRKQRKK